MGADEQVVIVDKDNVIVGQAPRREMREKNLIHRATFILVHNGDGAFFLQKRTATKDVYPGFYDPATGGVMTVGESYYESARRELGEELGIYGTPLDELFDFFWEDEFSRVWGRAFICEWNGPVVLQEEEVESGAFCPLADILSGKFQPMTPDSLWVIEKYAAEFHNGGV